MEGPCAEGQCGGVLCYPGLLSDPTSSDLGCELRARSRSLLEQELSRKLVSGRPCGFVGLYRVCTAPQMTAEQLGQPPLWGQAGTRISVRTRALDLLCIDSEIRNLGNFSYN